MAAETRTPRSVQLSNAHREQTVKNVIEAWEKKNPAPAGQNLYPLLLLIAKECKKHAAFKRTERIRAALDPKDWETDNLFQLSSRVLVRTVDPEGNEKGVESYVIPQDIADRAGLPYRRVASVWPDRGQGKNASQYPEHTLDPGDKNNVMSVLYISKDPIMVQLVETSAAYGKYKAAREARKDWERERGQLRSEVTDALEQFNTTKQLREHWPDIVDFLPAHVADPERAIQLPSVSVSKLNERLGLKSVRKGE